ncbi:uncharacterized protein BT62DRAFT_933665 [Guyanagaster necrorhizus]|uniref:Uncharacterized protein n=1 Tax=Guyanagaster necrorhizus TaxID=856835 RepID=A0A9P8AQR9_9AGAR|nr:uncharacterized protein BT62DRAFT_933665 [Guyanagaster necrorhizus MCA 3950]KAG7444633.1 hypothetical protein BT62DRAFT_933665 [Guyanagaster necrorhizus MCA 3950]
MQFSILTHLRVLFASLQGVRGSGPDSSMLPSDSASASLSNSGQGYIPRGRNNIDTQGSATNSGSGKPKPSGTTGNSGGQASNSGGSATNGGGQTR